MKAFRLFRLVLVAAPIAITLLVAAVAASPGGTERVSVDSAGNEANSESLNTAISADGRYVVFMSGASNLVPGDTNNTSDIFVHDRETGVTERVSVDSAGVQGNSGSGLFAAISGDGRFVAFDSHATNLVAGDTNGVGDVFVHDRQTGATQRASVDSAGNQGNGNSYDTTAISADGRFVGFKSQATNLLPGDTNDAEDIFVHDRDDDGDGVFDEPGAIATERVSVDSAGNQGDAGSGGPAISADGRYVAFYSYATNLVLGDTNGGWDVFVHDRQTGVTQRVSVDSNGNQGNGSSTGTAISPDGRFVAFGSNATNLVPGDTNGQVDVFVHERSIPVGGIAELPDTPGSSAPISVPLAALAAAALLALTASAWYARRRRAT